MAGKPKPMSQIKQILQLHQQGYGRKFIARSLDISKNTVKTYLDKVQYIKLRPEELLQLEDPVLEAKFHPGNPAYKDKRFDYLKEKFDYFSSELKQTGVTRRLLWEEYQIENPGGYGYTQFCYHLNQQLIAHKPSMVLNHKAGEKLFVDFAGKKLSYIDKETGEIIHCPVFVACLPYSDYSFAIVVRNQTIEDFIYAMGQCLEYFGGCPQVLVPDNLKAAIIKASPYEPDINRVFEDFANHYGCTIIPTRVAKPKDKALVENQVKMVYSRVYAKLRKQQFFDLVSLNQAVKGKVKEHNQTRMQQKPYCREEKFLADERPLLKPLPDDKFEIKYYRELKVAKNNHIYLAQDKHYYSVPYQWTGQKVKVIYTRSIVRIYANGSPVAVHQRDYKIGGYTTVKDHLCSHHQHYLDRSPGYYLDKAKEKSSTLYELITLLFRGGRYAEQNYKTCDGLFSLQRKTSPDVFEKACQSAIECQCYSYRFVLKVIENLKLAPQQDKKPEPLPVHKNIRGKDYYIQTTINF